MKRTFPYELSRYLLGLILSVLCGITISLILALTDGNPMSLLRAEFIIKCGVFILTPILVICSISKRYWTCIVVVVSVVMIWSIIAVIVLVPKAPNVSLVRHFWNCKGALYSPLLVYVLPGIVFQKFCNWCRITEAAS